MLNTIGKRIREKRKAMKMTQTRLAELTQKHAPDISDWENDKNTPGGENIKKLATILKTTTDYLIIGGAEKKEETEMNCITKLKNIINSPYLQKNEKAELLGYIQMFYEKEKEERGRDEDKKIHTLQNTKKHT